VISTSTSAVGRPLLAVDDIHIRFGGIKAADGVTLDVIEGETLAIIGPNGAGKTTFINICTGYLKPQRGDIRFDGRSIRGLPPRGITRIGIARSFQIPQLFLEHTVRENLLLAAAARDREWRPWRVLERVGAAGEMLELLALFDLGDTADREIGTLPEGSRKLIDIALALALRPRLLLMDEPTSGVASSEKFAVMDALRHALAARSVTAVFVEHDMEVVERYASRVAVWNQGRILAVGATQAILQDASVLREVTGVEHAPVA
jgi:branched-chain amino acid transport system ATP-binding protein